MKFMKIMKDGGPESKVTGLFFVEIKSLFSVVLLKFENGSRDSYHTHAFNACSWVLKGKLVEQSIEEHVVNGTTNEYLPSLRPIFTPRSMFHKVISVGTTYALTFRGPWKDSWSEYLPAQKKYQTLMIGRKVKY